MKTSDFDALSATVPGAKYGPINPPVNEMTLRDHFAAMMYQKCYEEIVEHENVSSIFEANYHAARRAYQHADAMLRQRYCYPKVSAIAWEADEECIAGCQLCADGIEPS